MRSQMSSIALERFTSFGDLLKFLRRKSGLTQRELSIAVGYSHAQISRLELNQRQPDLATITARFIPVLDLEEEPEVAERLLELAVEMPQSPQPAAGQPPFRGLRFFDESDAGWFFGREKLTRLLLDRARERILTSTDLRFLAIIGASGSGKSSILRAGLIPVLRRTGLFSGWTVYTFTPTDRPLQALASTLTSGSASVISTTSLLDDLSRDHRALHLTGARITNKVVKISPRSRTSEGLLLAIDQFEELFTLCQSEAERSAFIDNLITAVTEAGGKVFVILTLRADFYSHCAPYPTLRDALAKAQEYIGVMSTDELRRVMEEPAKYGDWELEPGLVELLLQDIGADGEHSPEPGALPLLSHALLETWYRRQGRKLTISGYLATGGVRGAIADTADDVYQNEFNDSQQTIARNIFLRLTQFGEDEDTAGNRRRVTFDELVHASEDEPVIRDVLTKLANARLITTDNEIVEVAHEALIREWPTLRAWLEEDREGLRLHRHLTLAAESWERQGQDPGELYRGARLAAAVAWAETHTDKLSGREETFLSASKEFARQEENEREAQRHRELEAAQALAETQQKAATQLRKRAFYLSGAFLLALIMFGLAMFQGNRARQIARTAQDERRIATSRELAAASLNNLEVDPERSILLALQSVSTTRSADGTVLPESLEALHRSLVTSALRMTLHNHKTRVLSAQYSPDGKQLATIGDDGTVIFWDPINGEEKFRLPGNTTPSDFVTSQRIAYSPDGKRFAACNANQVGIADPITGNLLRTLTGFNSDATAVAFSRDGNYLAAGSADGTTLVWNLQSNRLPLELSGHIDAVESLTFSPNGKWLVTVSDDTTVKIWDAGSGNLLHDYTDFTGEVISVIFNPAGTKLALTTVDGLHIWQIDSKMSADVADLMNQQILTIPETGGLAFSPDGTKIAGPSGSNNSGNAIKLWDAATGRELLALVGHTGWVMGMAFSPDGQQLASTSLDGTVKIWSLAPGNETITVSSPPAGYGTRVTFNSNGREFATNGGDGTATIWDIETGKPRLQIRGQGLEILNIAFRPDGKRLATGGLDGTAIIWDTTTGEQMLTLPSNELGVRDVSFSPDGSLFATGGFDGVAKIWDANTGALIHEFTGHNGLVLGVAFNSDGSRLATSSTDATAKIWDVSTGKLLLTLTGHAGAIPDISYSPDGKLLATGSGDGTAIIWDAESGSKLLTLIGHSSQIQSVAFSPDGKLLATGSEDNTAKIWDLATGHEVLTIPGGSGGVRGVSFSPSDGGSHLIVSSGDGLARVFLLHLDDLLALAQSRITRSFTTEECRKYLHGEQCPSPQG